MRRQRAFQPTADPLEPREVQSALAVPAHIVHPPLNHRIQFNTPLAHVLHLGFTAGGFSMGFSRAATRPGATPVRVLSPGATPGMMGGMPGMMGGMPGMMGGMPGMMGGMPGMH